MKHLVLAVLAITFLAGCAFAAPVVKSGLSYSIVDANFEQVSLIECYKKDALSLNFGFRRNDTVVADVGYDLGKWVEPVKNFVSSNPFLKPFSPILNLVNPSVDLYAGSKVLRDNMELVLNRAEFDYGVNVVAIQVRW